MRRILQTILNILAQLYIWRYKPDIIAITGNVGKTSTKEAIAVVLRETYKVRVSGGNLNNELGVPLTILGDWARDYYDSESSFIFWLKVFMKGFFGLFSLRTYPDILILEYGADKPGDIKRLACKFRPHIAIVTAIGEVPVHVEYFSGPEALAREKSRLLEVLKLTDYAVLNFDDQTVLDMKGKTKARVWTYGLGERADVKVSNFDFKVEKPVGVAFKLHYEDSFVPVRIEGSIGKSQAWAAGAAAAVGLILGMNLVKISEALLNYRGPAGRLKVLEGIKNTTIIDDTYNASPAAMHLALETLKAFPAKRKVAVLGDMLELGRYTIEAHREAGNLAGSIVDLLVCVGSRAKFIADSAENQMDSGNIYIFETSDLAKSKVQELIREGDLILAKGSQGMRMEKVVEEIMAEPEKKKELLVRQGKKWFKQ